MKDNKLGIMPISKLIWNMSLPIIVSMLVQALYNIVDSVFVSQVSEQALTAVTLAFPAQNLMIGLATGHRRGRQCPAGPALGAGDGKRADQVTINRHFPGGGGLCTLRRAGPVLWGDLLSHPDGHRLHCG